MQRYETYIRETEKELIEALEAVEEAGWHHMEKGTLEGRTYDRLLTWISTIVERRERLDARR